MKHCFATWAGRPLSLSLALSAAGIAASLLLAGCGTPGPVPAIPAARMPGSLDGTAAVGDEARTRELTTLLRDGAAPLHDRARACQQLASCGSVAAVPVLSSLLGDEKLGDYAREALETMPHADAGAALRASLETLRGRARVGVIHSLGQRGDAKAVGALRRLVSAGDSEERSEALLALGRIATPEAVAAVRGALSEKGGAAPLQSAAEACNEAAGVLLRRGQRVEAAALFDLVRASGAGGQARLTALRGVLLARGDAARGLLAELLRSPESAVFAVALGAAREIPGSATTGVLERSYATLGAEARAVLLPVLAERGSSRMPALAERCVADAAAPVRLAALRVLGRHGAASSVAVLLEAAGMEARPEESAAALTSLAQLRAPGVDAAVLAATVRAAVPLQVRLIGVLGQRGDAALAGEVLRLGGSANPDVRRAAFRALDSLSRPGDQRAIFDLLRGCTDEENRRLLERAAIVAAMKSDPPERRAELVSAELAAATDPAYRAALQRVRDKLASQAR